MLTPVAFAEHLSMVHGKEVDGGKGHRPSRLDAFSVRALCYGVVWQADGTYAWFRPEHAAAREVMATNADLPPDGAPTPEARARELLARVLATIQASGTDAEAGLTHDEVVDLCSTVVGLSDGTYPWRLSDEALAVRVQAALGEDAAPGPR